MIFDISRCELYRKRFEQPILFDDAKHILLLLFYRFIDDGKHIVPVALDLPPNYLKDENADIPVWSQRMPFLVSA